MSAHASVVLKDFQAMVLRFLVLKGNDCVSAVKSSGSFTAVRALALRVCSTRQIVVLSTSSVRLRLSKFATITFLQIRTSLSKIPLKCGAPGGMNFQTTFYCTKSISILALSHS